MEENIPKYKLCTVSSVNTAEALDYFANFIKEEIFYKDKEAYLCIEGSLLIFHCSGIQNLVFLEIHCNVIAKPGEGTIHFVAIAKFVKFCSLQKTDIKILRNSSIVPSSMGAVISDFDSSLAYKKAMHYARYSTCVCYEVH
ncbi:hypothetical protein I8752_12305 [Nostocaceae cyanobacterium CENA369]|uniref:Uncharacterized protein n=1 Tax=Dendronalium phyllosphericum CENA369 TaxID=1725256 RepID=A0A8J7I4U1_9NOST|nr:hypothetical protein [Dendronalium phyllosphericum]MBH8573788.1 hypothetical protein [Dendronalium phyllosphericum CENA369]